MVDNLSAFCEKFKFLSELNCEAFIKEEICTMTPEEQELWFLELLESILEDVIEKKKTGIDV